MALWNAHFSVRPADAVELLLAQILVAVINSNTEKGKGVQVHEVAPWLESKERRDSRLDREDREELSLVLDVINNENRDDGARD